MAINLRQEKNRKKPMPIYCRDTVQKLAESLYNACQHTAVGTCRECLMSPPTTGVANRCFLNNGGSMNDSKGVASFRRRLIKIIERGTVAKK